MKRRPSFFFGTLSLLVVMVILVLASFAVLSLVSASNDHQLSSKNARNIIDYYDADAVAEDKLAGIMKTILNHDDWQEKLREQGYDVEQTQTGVNIYYSAYISDDKEIKVRIDVTIKADGSVGAIDRAVWQTKSIVFEEDDSGGY